MNVNLGFSLLAPPPAMVTITSSSPAAVAAVLALISVSETTSTAVAVLPIFTVAPFTNPVPLITTLVPPSVEPLDGSTLVTVGGVTNVNFGPADEEPISLVTTTSTAPAACAAVTAVISVSETTFTLVASSPIFTVEPFKNPVPLIFTDVPPVVGPVATSTEATFGGATYVNVGPPEDTPFVSVTTIESAPATVAAVVALISVSETTSTPVAELPIFTVAPSVNPVPVITTSVPPNVEPVAGSTFVTDGGVM